MFCRFSVLMVSLIFIFSSSVIIVQYVLLLPDKVDARLFHSLLWTIPHPLPHNSSDRVAN